MQHSPPSGRSNSAAAASHDQASATQTIQLSLPALWRAAAQLGSADRHPIRHPNYWSPEAAPAIFEFVDEMRDIILAVYGTPIRDAARQRCQSAPTERVIIPDDELPF